MPAARLEFVPNELPVKQIIRGQPLKPLPTPSPLSTYCPPHPSSPLLAAAPGQNGGHALPAAIAPSAGRTISFTEGGGHERRANGEAGPLRTPQPALRPEGLLSSFYPFLIAEEALPGRAGRAAAHSPVSSPPPDKMAPPRAGRAPLLDT